jgi:hypothetical protein
MKHKPFKSTLLLMLLTFSINALGADWSTVIKNKDSVIAVDMDSYDETSGYPAIITRTKFSKVQTTELSAKKVSYIEQRAMPQFNCSTHQIKTTKLYLFDTKGKKIATVLNKDQFTLVIADSSDAQLESLVCQVHKMVGGM